MKVTLGELKRVIREEVSRLMLENAGDTRGMEALNALCRDNPDLAEYFQDVYDSAKEDFMRGEISSFEVFKGYIPLESPLKSTEFTEDLGRLYRAMSAGSKVDTGFYHDAESGITVAGPERWARSTAYSLGMPAGRYRG